MINKNIKVDPYSALRFREFNIFLVVRFILVFSWSMQFIIVEWLVWEITKKPIVLGFNRPDGSFSGSFNGSFCWAYC
jgi:hypothetical protein